MLKHLAALAFVASAIVAAPAGAAPPEIARVEGVPAGDTLMIRSEPRATAPSIGVLREGDGPIEILETIQNGSTEWARIGLAEGEGWAARRFLKEVEPERFGDTSLTVGLICSGTEPFWSASLSGTQEGSWRDPETGATTRVAITGAVGASGRVGWPAALTLSGDGFTGVLVATPTECSDGMSDRAYPWTATLLDQTTAGGRLFEGCCGLRPAGRPN